MEAEFNALQKKYDALFTEVSRLKSEADAFKQGQQTWEKEKRMLYDTIGKYEQQQEAKVQDDIKGPSPTAPKKPSTSKKGQKPGASICMSTLNGRTCKIKALVGSKYCWHHSPLDPDSDYVFCKECQNPVRKDSGQVLCTTHLQQAKKRPQEDKGDEKPSKKQKTEHPQEPKANTSTGGSGKSSTSKKSAPGKPSASQSTPPAGSTPVTPTPQMQSVINTNVSSPSFPIMGIPVPRVTNTGPPVSHLAPTIPMGVSPFVYQQYFYQHMKPNTPQPYHQFNPAVMSGGKGPMSSPTPMTIPPKKQ